MYEVGLDYQTKMNTFKNQNQTNFSYSLLQNGMNNSLNKDQDILRALRSERIAIHTELYKVENELTKFIILSEGHLNAHKNNMSSSYSYVVSKS
jgi:hypothetical protein